MWTCTLENSPASDFAALAAAFAERNPGYGMEWHGGLQQLPAEPGLRVAFVQGGGGSARAGTEQGVVGLGDLIVLPPGTVLDCDNSVDLLVFALPGEVPAGVPTFVRPDFDPQLTDTPGGCAEETDAYRRLLLTWRPEAGPYVCRALNAHRVRMWDSFSHYHPVEGGFEELYLVQAAPPGAQLHWAPGAEEIERSAEWTRERAATWVQTLPLSVGQLVVIPRGFMHRAVGGALAQVITVPGFVPQREIGVDGHLRELQRRFGFEGSERIPYCARRASD